MMLPSLTHERALWQQGYSTVVGVDEVGRGAWAGPLVAAAVCLSPKTILSTESLAVSPKRKVVLPGLLRDSKRLSAPQRTMVAKSIQDVAKQWAYGLVEVDEINELGVGKANELAMMRAIEALDAEAHFILIDGNRRLTGISTQQEAIIKGDSLIASIAAASILAKVHRDELMCRLSKKYPEFGFDQHKGYGTKLHQLEIIKYGLSPLHRKKYKLKFLV